MTWINRYWAKTGGIISLGIIVFIFISGTKLTDIKSLLWLHFAALLLHQFEEYVFPGKFVDFFNKNAITKFPLNDLGVILVNIVLGWTAYFLSAVLNVKILWLAIGLLGITITNGILHTMMSFIKKKYVPGVITGSFLFIPFGLFALLKTMRIVTRENIILGIMVFIIGTALIPISIYITNKIGLPYHRK